MAGLTSAEANLKSSLLAFLSIIVRIFVAKEDEHNVLVYAASQVTERMSAERLIILAPKEWEAGNVRIKHLDSREESDVSIADLTGATG